LRHSTTIKHFHFVIQGEEMRNVYTFAGLTFALALAFSLTTAAQTSSTEPKQQASPDQSQTDSARNMHRDRVGERLKWLSQQLHLTEDQKKQLKPILANEFKTNESGGQRRITDSRSKAKKDEANPRGFATAGQAILTPEQQQKFAQMKEDAKE
jgi:Spy/CpxP family protein refolding chaperone